MPLPGQPRGLAAPLAAKPFGGAHLGAPAHAAQAQAHAAQAQAAQLVAAAGGPLRGTVKTWNDDKGFGFIVTPGQDDIFVHRVDLVGVEALNLGDQVTYTREWDPRKQKWMAKQVSGGTGTSTKSTAAVPAGAQRLAPIASGYAPFPSAGYPGYPGYSYGYGLPLSAPPPAGLRLS